MFTSNIIPRNITKLGPRWFTSIARAFTRLLIKRNASLMSRVPGQRFQAACCVTPRLPIKSTAHIGRESGTKAAEWGTLLNARAMNWQSPPSSRVLPTAFAACGRPRLRDPRLNKIQPSLHQCEYSVKHKFAPSLECGRRPARPGHPSFRDLFNAACAAVVRPLRRSTPRRAPELNAETASQDSPAAALIPSSRSTFPTLEPASLKPANSAREEFPSCNYRLTL